MMLQLSVGVAHREDEPVTVFLSSPPCGYNTDILLHVRLTKAAWPAELSADTAVCAGQVTLTARLWCFCSLFLPVKCTLIISATCEQLNVTSCEPALSSGTLSLSLFNSKFIYGEHFAHRSNLSC